MKHLALVMFFALVSLTGCIPKIEVSAPKEPLTINMNFKSEHTIHIDASHQAAKMLPKQQ